MLQVRTMREFTPHGQLEPITYDKPFNPRLLFSSFQQYFDEIEDKIKDIPDEEKVNLFLTLHDIKESEASTGDGKAFDSQRCLFFDVDKVTTRQDVLYRKALGEALKVDPAKIAQVFTGGGYHFIIELQKPITSTEYFTKFRTLYQVLCLQVNSVLRKHGLEGEADQQVFAPNRLTRVPSSINRKPERRDSVVELVWSKLEPIDFNFYASSGLPEVHDQEQLSGKELAYHKIDSPSVESGCEFLKWAFQEQAVLNETQWYAMLSIVGRLEDGETKIHEYSKFHPRYSYEGTKTKAEQALKASGPRTCDNIDSLWDGCKSCPHYKKIRSPIIVKGKDFIGTAHCGFHAPNAKGTLTPQYEDLKKYYEKTYPYKNINKTHFRYEEAYWREIPDDFIDNFAQVHFSPTANNTKRSEFKGLVRAYNVDTPQFFSRSSDRHLNLANGVLNIDTGELKEHSPDYGFRSILPFAYDPEAKCPLFSEHLDAITQGDKSLRSILLEFMGYALSNDIPKAQKILILDGEGQNGKSTFLNILRALGGSAVTSVSAKDLSSGFHKQALDGALFNIMEEVPEFSERDFWEEMKGLITGSMVMASKKFKDVYSFINKCKFIMTCNSLPKGASISHGYFRRLLIVPFNARFEGSNDKKGIDQLIVESELPGVLNAALWGYKKLKANDYNFTQSQASTKVLDDYKLDVDSVAMWFKDNVVVLDEARQESSELVGDEPSWIARTKDGDMVAIVEEMYLNYKTDTLNMGLKPVAFNKFSKRLVTSSSPLLGDQCKITRTQINKRRGTVITNVLHNRGNSMF